MMTRAEHLQWAKTRALDYCDRGDRTAAWASLMSDLSKHPELADHLGIELGMNMLLVGFLKTDRDMRDFIEGFN